MIRRLFQVLKPSLQRLYRRLDHKRPPNLLYDRDVEFAFISAALPEPQNGSACALDFGCGSACLSLLALQKGYVVTAVDLTDPEFGFEHDGFFFLEAGYYDVRKPKTL